MITEILGALIVLGAVLVLIMRRLLSKGKDKAQESVEVSASRLRYEIERSGDAVIGRMQIHVERLERLLAEANAQKTALDERLSALAQWEKVYGAKLGALPQQMAAADSLHPAAPPAAVPVQQVVPPIAPHSSAAGVPSSFASIVSEAGEAASSFQAALMEHMQGGSVGGSIDMHLPPENLDSGSVNPPHADVSRQRNVHQQALHGESVPIVASPQEMVAEAVDDDVPEYEDSEDEEGAEDEYEDDETEEEEYEYDDEALTDEADLSEEVVESEEMMAAVDEAEDEEADEEESKPGKSLSADAFHSRQQEQIRAFLRQGLSVEEISQRLGLGLGAVELVRHMEKRTQEAKDQAAQDE